MSTSTPTAGAVPDSEFDRAIAVSPEGDGAWTTELSPGWRIADAVNGGLLLALAGNTLRQQLGGDPGETGVTRHADPLAISAYYLSAARPGPATLRTETVRAGRAMSTGQVSISQDAGGRSVERVRALATLGDLAEVVDGESAGRSVPPVELPDPDACVSASDVPPGLLTHADFLDRVDVRLDPATAGWARGRPSRRGEIRGWMRLPDGREPDPLLLLLAVDALPPVAFDLGLSGWTPTLELTTYVRARPAPGWLRVSLTARHHGGGFLEEDADVWDSAGHLVAQSRQLTRTATPRA